MDAPGDPVDLELTKRWLKATAILFAVGAVSATVLSFELGLLWPRFMRWAPVIGMPFSLEGFAFFMEAIFLGIYLYGWNRVPKMAHWLSGVVVAVSGCVSGIFVVCANAWMTRRRDSARRRQGGGRRSLGGDVQPAAFQQTLHMTIAAYLSVAFAAAGIHAYMLLRRPDSAFHRRALTILLPVAAVTALLPADLGRHQCQERRAVTSRSNSPRSRPLGDHAPGAAADRGIVGGSARRLAEAFRFRER